jgi:hypothetical protein
MYFSSGPFWEVKRQFCIVHKTNGLDDVPHKERTGHTNDLTAPPIHMTKILRKGFSQTDSYP